MNSLYFAQPQWFHLFWTVAVSLGMMIWLERRAGGDLTQFMHPLLQSRLVRAISPTRRYLRIILLGLCGFFLILSLMRPQWGVRFVATPRVGAEIMVCLDVSKSMLAEDVAPSRLERAKVELTDLLTYLSGDQVGLIAFAGRASVLSPLTPDFGFLRLVLDQAGPHSVVRGGTRLEEPIRKAIAGFGDTADISRSILLITDGEDHDSFPLEAAKEAAERGVRILSIGFGDENGSEIMMSDPKTGARSVLRDGDGKIVISRLDGDLLREIALLTEGAYIPAGTGVLDLKSIFDTHIASLTRGKMDGRGRTIRNDAFQITLLLGLLCLLGAVVSTIGSRYNPRPLSVMVDATTASKGTNGRPNRNTVLSLLAFNITTSVIMTLLSLLPGLLVAQQEDKKPVVIFSDEPEEVLEVETDPAEAESNQYAEEEEEDARTLYNQALQKFDTNSWEQATRLFQEARRLAGTDGVARFNATYNLGWVDVKKADDLLETDPAAGLKSLYRAADWFREAVALREDIDARHNLEVVLQRAMVLADSLEKKQTGDLLARISQNITIQREFLDVVRQEVDLEEVETYTSEQLRGQLRSLAVQQLEVLSQSQQLTKIAGREVDTLRGKTEKEQTPEDKMRVAQIEGLLHYLHRAQERMGQARRRLRTSQTERAYRRAAIALAELKRGRDQLLDPVARIDALLSDGMELIQQTAAKAANNTGKLSLQTGNKLPAWLTQEYLVESQTSLSERVQELHQGLSAGLTGEAEGTSAAALRQQQLIENLRLAVPWLGTAGEKFSQALAKLEHPQFEEAFGLQNEGITALAAAREIFLDLRQLVELVYQDQLRIQRHLDPSTAESTTLAALHRPGGNSAIDRSSRKRKYLRQIAEYFPLVSEFQQKNLERTEQLAKLIQLALKELKMVQQQLEAQSAQQPQPGSQPGRSLPQQNQPAQAPEQAEQMAAQEERLQEAEKLRKQALTEFSYNQKILTGLMTKTGKNALSTAVLKPLRFSVKDSIKTIEKIRRLFFSLVEHLRETTEKQVELGDETQNAVTLAKTATDAETAARMGPLSSRQATLSTAAGAIAEALAKESQQLAQQPMPSQGSSGDPGQMVEKYLQAGQLVGEATVKMYGVASMMAEEKIPLEEIGPQQNAASEDLIRALALLQPPQQESQQDQQQERKKSQEQEQQKANEPQQQDADQRSDGNMNQMLQGVRDREAQRRQDQQERQKQSAGYQPVEKDW